MLYPVELQVQKNIIKKEHATLGLAPKESLREKPMLYPVELQVQKNITKKEHATLGLAPKESLREKPMLYPVELQVHFLNARAKLMICLSNYFKIPSTSPWVGI